MAGNSNGVQCPACCQGSYWLIYGALLPDEDVHYYIGERLKLEGETENMSVCTKE